MAGTPAGWPTFSVPGHKRAAESVGYYLGSLDSPETMRLLDTKFRAAFAAPGHLLFVREGTLLAQPFDVATRQLRGNALPVAEHVGSGQATGEAPFSTSTRALAYTVSIGSPPTQLTWVDRAGQPHGTIGTRAEYENPTLSPDNQHVAVHRVDPILGTEVWLMDSTRSNPSRLTFERAINFAPTWSPDGRHIAFSSNRSGTFGLYQKLSSGAG